MVFYVVCVGVYFVELVVQCQVGGFEIQRCVWCFVWIQVLQFGLVLQYGVGFGCQLFGGVLVEFGYWQLVGVLDVGDEGGQVCCGIGLCGIQYGVEQVVVVEVIEVEGFVVVVWCFVVVEYYIQVLVEEGFDGVFQEGGEQCEFQWLVGIGFVGVWQGVWLSQGVGVCGLLFVGVGEQCGVVCFEVVVVEGLQWVFLCVVLYGGFVLVGGQVVVQL